MFDFTPPPGFPGLLWTIFAYIGAFALVWVNVLIGGLVNGMVMLVSGPMIDKLLKKPMVQKITQRLGLKDL
jgi:hypothetical protein